MLDKHVILISLVYLNLFVNTYYVFANEEILQHNMKVIVEVLKAT